MGLNERTSTAIELARQKIDAPDWWIEQQLADAVNTANRVQPRSQLPIRFTRFRTSLAVSRSGVIDRLIRNPNEQFATLAQQQAVQQAIAKEATQLETIRKDVETNNKLTDDQKKELTQPLNDAIKKLQSGDLTKEQALSQLNKTENQLRQLANPTIQQQAQAMQQAGQSLSQNSQTQAAGEALKNNDLAGAAQALKNTDLSKMTPAEQQQLAKTLEQTAQGLQSSNPQTAQQLQQAAEALRQGNTSAAQQAMNNAANQMANMASQVNQAQAASQAANQVAQSQQGIAQSGNPNNKEIKEANREINRGKGRVNPDKDKRRDRGKVRQDKVKRKGRVKAIKAVRARGKGRAMATCKDPKPEIVRATMRMVRRVAATLSVITNRFIRRIASAARVAIK